MKNDPTFKFVAAIVLAGVLVALAAPNRVQHPHDENQSEATPAAHHAE